MSIFLTIFNDPKQAEQLTLKQWELLIREARSANLLAYLASFLEKNKINNIPSKAQNHLNAALIFSYKQRSNVVLECQKLAKIFKAIDVQPIFLKGAAYSIANLDLSKTRLLSDIDVLVKKEDLQKAEQTLFQQGWFAEEITDYDDKYYRQWAHEIPPLKHIRRHTILDLHHNILALMTGHIVDTTTLHENKVESCIVPNTYTLNNPLLVMHSAVHLFHEGEFDKGLRDLIDIKTMIETFSKSNDNFLAELIKTAQYHNFEREIYLAIKYIDLVLNGRFMQSKGIKALFINSQKWDSSLLDFCFVSVFQPYHSNCQSWKKSLAEFLLLWRGHFLRMPITQLIPHLIKKSSIKLTKLFSKTA